MPLHKPTIEPRTRRNKVTGVVTTDFEIHFGWVNKKPIRRFVKTLPEAQKKAKKLYTQLLRQTEEAMTLSPSQINECAIAFSRLRDNNCQDSILEIVDGHINRIKQQNSISTSPLTTFGTLKLGYEAEMGQKTLSKRYLVTTKQYLRRFEEVIGKDTVCANLTTNGVVGILEKMTRGVTKTFNNTLGCVSALFNLGVKRKQITENPLIGAERKRELYTPPCFFTADRVQAILLEGMDTPRANECMPWFILGSFCGIRTAEIGRMYWENILWEERIIRIEMPKGYTKGCKPRFVTLNDAAFEWISLYRRDSGTVGCTERYFGKWKRRLKNFSKGSPNVMRHTFATAHYAKFRDIRKTADELGHYQNIQTTLNHYRALMPPSIAESFWSLRPPIQPATITQEHPEAIQEPKDGQETLLPCLLHNGIPVANAM